MINMRENSFDIESTKKKIRNFLRQEISKRPEMVERWNAIMNDDVDKYDDYKDLAFIEKIFKNYKGKFSGIQYEPDINSFKFFLPLEINYDWEEAKYMAKEMEEDAKKYFGIQNVECHYLNDDSSHSRRFFYFTLRFGNSYLTPKRKANGIIKELLKDYGNLIGSVDSSIKEWNDKTRSYDKEVPIKVYIYEKRGYREPIISNIWWTITSEKAQSGISLKLYVHINDNYAEVYIENDTTISEALKEIRDTFDFSRKGENE